MFGEQQRWLKYLAVLMVVLLPISAHWIYTHWTRLPDTIRIAAGSEGGLYLPIAQDLAKDLRAKGVKVEVVETTGSLQNLKMLKDNKVEFALYQSGTASRFDELQSKVVDGESSIRFIANLFPEKVHLVSRFDVRIQSIADLSDKNVAVGEVDSGDYAMAMWLFQKFGIKLAKERIHALKFADLPKAFAEKRIDAAILTVGSRAPILMQLFSSSDQILLPILQADALTQHDVVLSTTVIPTGLYRPTDGGAPGTDIQSIALNAQLLCRDDVSTTLGETVTNLVVNQAFARRNQLKELFEGGRDFAQRKPEFELHPGARSVFEPEIRPLLNPDFVEATEGMRSFVVSILIAAFLCFRWWKNRIEKAQEHRLDRYIRDLLEIERRQLGLDGPDRNLDDVDALQDLLDEVTKLRQNALEDFSAHELNDDRAADCFLEMCHALSDKINAKMTRLRFDEKIEEFIELTQKKTDD
ncbi:MAG: hypothetical protein CMJ78_15445 [Planctomycetaceae bacterium]|nr:hypothetical protein [Planctomycetaceae bacterium]